jgi:hypothetical protein
MLVHPQDGYQEEDKHPARGLTSYGVRFISLAASTTTMGTTRESRGSELATRVRWHPRVQKANLLPAHLSLVLLLYISTAQRQIPFLMSAPGAPEQHTISSRPLENNGRAIFTRLPMNEVGICEIYSARAWVGPSSKLSLGQGWHCI